MRVGIWRIFWEWPKGNYSLRRNCGILEHWNSQKSLTSIGQHFSWFPTRKASKLTFRFIQPVHVHLKTDNVDYLKTPSWKKNFCIFLQSPNQVSWHEKCCRTLVRLFWLFQCSRIPQLTLTGADESHYRLDWKNIRTYLELPLLKLPDMSFNVFLSINAIPIQDFDQKDPSFVGEWKY